MVCTTRTIIDLDVDLFTKQRELIGALVSSLELGRTGISIMPDLPVLRGVRDTLDAINDQNNLDGCADDYDGPDCPGCVKVGTLCDDCEYVDDLDVTPTG